MAETSENHTDEEEDLVGEEEGGTGIEGGKGGGAGEKRKRPLNKKSLGGFSKRGVCYLSRVPPHMNPSHVRQIFSKHGDVQRIYLVPEEGYAMMLASLEKTKRTNNIYLRFKSPLDDQGRCV